MGTRAQFFVGNPVDLDTREWLGTVAWDGYPGGDVGDALSGVRDEAAFRAAVAIMARLRDDFCDPASQSFPFPWRDDLFLTDCTYAWFDGGVQFTSFHRGFIPLDRYCAEGDEGTATRDAYHDQPEQLAGDVPAPVSDKPRGPDSIMILSVAR